MIPMKWLRKSLVVSLILVLVLAACDLLAPTEPPTPTNTPEGATAEPTHTPLATSDLPTTITAIIATDTPEPTATEIPTFTPTVTPELVSSERLVNPDFEDGFYPWYAGGNFVGAGWQPVICTDCPIPKVCEEGQTTGCNPSGLHMRTPEYKDAAIWVDPFRILSGAHSQQWFCAAEHCQAGITQMVDTAPGEQCTVSAWVQTWGAAGGRSCWSNTLYRSDYCTDDDMANMHMMIVVNLDGDPITLPLSGHYVMVDFGFYDGIYDEPDGGAPIAVDFVATQEQTAVALIGYQLYPVGNANWYVDLASVWCVGEAVPPVEDEPTPTPRATSVPTIEPVELSEAMFSDIEAQGIKERDSWWHIALGILLVMAYPVYRFGRFINDLRSKKMELKDITPVIGPLLNLLRSRKFMVAVFTMIIDVVVAYVPELEGVRTELLTIFTLIGSLVIGGIAYEDGKTKSAPKA